MFIKVAVDELDPMLVMELRCIIGAIPLWLTAWFLRRRRGERIVAESVTAVRSRPWSLLALGLLTGMPLWFVALGEEHIDSGLAGIVNASVPLWAALLAIRFDREHPTGPRRLLGVGVGFAGVVLLAAARGALGGSAEVIGILTVACAGLMYAAGAILVRERLGGLPSVENAAWSVTIAALLFAIPAARVLPDSLPSAEAMGSLFALGFLGTFLGFLGYYELLTRVGAARATMVTYLLPPLAVGYGWLLLEERVGIESFGAMLIVLLGVWLGSRPERIPRAEPAA